jgi:hypothetical protein
MAGAANSCATAPDGGVLQRAARLAARTSVTAFQPAAPRPPARDGAHAFFVEAQQHVLVAEHCLDLAEAAPAIGRLQAADGLQDGEAALVDRALGQPDMHDGADHRLGEAAHLEALLEVGLRACRDRLARQVALDASLRGRGWCPVADRRL